MGKRDLIVETRNGSFLKRTTYQCIVLKEHIRDNIMVRLEDDI
jgi:hypothetical protein